MADNVVITPGSGATIAADDIGGGILAQRIKLSLGPDGTGNDALAGSGVNGVGVQRVTIATDDAVNTALGTLHTDLTATNSQLPATPSGTVQVTITRPANVTAYSANTVVVGALTIATGLTSGQRGMIVGADLMLQIASIPSGMTSFRLYLYNVTPPSAITNATAWDLPSGDRASFLGYVDVGTPVDLGSTCFCQADGGTINKQFQLSGSANLFGYLVTNGGFTPAANSEVYLLRLQILGL
jgi:hypothetical protein